VIYWTLNLNLENPFVPWNPFAPVHWLSNQLNWLTSQFLVQAGLALVWMLTCLPPGLGYVGYIVAALWLSGWVSRHIPMTPLNPNSPMFHQPGGGRLWLRLGMFDLLLAAGGAGIGAYIPAGLADTIWRNPYNPFVDTLGPMGRMAEIVGLACGFRIAIHCRLQLNLLMVIGLIGYFGLRTAAWVLGG
jgi:hypothetical protein